MGKTRMTKEDAEKLIRQALSQMALTLAQHNQLQQAVTVLVGMTGPKEVKKEG